MVGLPSFWLDSHAFAGRALAPLGALTAVVTRLRRRYIQPQPLPVPVLIIGNIFIGGTGKTPIVAAVAQMLRAAGHRPGILVRGYRGKAQNWPQRVTPQSDPELVGDEPVLLARRSGCPVMAGPDRIAAARALLQDADCDCLISDDGLQHYRLPRRAEIVVMDASRGLGNGRCLPAGPLREPVSRLKDVDLVLFNGGSEAQASFELVAQPLRRVDGKGDAVDVTTFRGPVHAVAGIGNPQRFFDALRAQGLDVIEHPFPDHYAYRREDFAFGDELPILMTEKDAVKAAAFAQAHHWYQPVEVALNDSAHAALDELLNDLWNPDHEQRA